MGLGELIKARRESLGLTLAELAAAVGATKGYLSMIENRKVANPPSPGLLEALEKALGISPGELIRVAQWEGLPQELKKSVEAQAQVARQGRELAKMIRQSAGKRGDGARNLDQLYRSGELGRLVKGMLKESSPAIETVVPLRFEVPLINKVAAGYPRDFTDLDYPARVADSYVHVPELADPQAFAARVVGESMAPDYHEGDIVVFSPLAKIESGHDCFVRLEPHHECTFKRVYFESGMVRLQPINPQFPPRILPREEVAGLYKAVWRFQRLG